MRANALIRSELGSVQVAELTTDRLLRWRNALASAPAYSRTKRGKALLRRKSPNTDDAKRARRATANRTLTILQVAPNRAFKHGIIDDDLAWRRVMPFGNVGHARPGYLTVPEAKRLQNAADAANGFRDLVRAALMTGCRYGELATMHVKDFHRGKLAIYRSKSGKARDVVLGAEGIALFDQLCTGRARDELLLPNRANGRAWQRSEQIRPMKAACAAARLTPVGFHQLRHTWASHAISCGMPLMVVARDLGHARHAHGGKTLRAPSARRRQEAVRANAPKFGVVPPSNVTPMPGGRRS